eukprot:CAMPEP_0172925556 /NCGR_PEP_ID=MMETSP1075-20121228/213935_1 /TAXON_ID=2916 /ORGANISM="Ceratium fusus, Strain PA161109" /LENGTH=1249 /DNA_ID=CAMNT_0013786471 /DNA_START=29 /DNA_END=3778 /DNA_ORIENTATION=+
MSGLEIAGTVLAVAGAIAELCKRILAQTKQDTNSSVRGLEARAKATLNTIQRFQSSFAPSKLDVLEVVRQTLAEVNDEITTHRLRSRLRKVAFSKQHKENFENLEKRLDACLQDLSTAVVVEVHAKAAVNFEQMRTQLDERDAKLLERQQQEDHDRAQVMQCLRSIKEMLADKTLDTKHPRPQAAKEPSRAWWQCAAVVNDSHEDVIESAPGITRQDGLVLMERLLLQSRDELVRDMYEMRELVLWKGAGSLPYATFQQALGLVPERGRAALAALGDGLRDNFEYDDDPSEDDDSDHESSCLGEGNFGRVHRMRSRVDGCKYAVKFIRKSRATSAGLDESRLLDEVENLAILDHPNILKYFCHYEDKKGKFLCIVTELAQGGTVMEALCSAGSLLPLERAKCWMLQLCSALAHMHKVPMLHRDLKLSNLFLDAHDNIKVGDLGLASAMGMRSMLSSVRGNEAYKSPEKARGERYNEKDDQWAAGVVFSELLTGQNVVQRCKDGDPCFAKNATAVRKAKEESLQRSADLGSITSELLESMPHKRPSASEVVDRLTSLCTTSVAQPWTLETLTKEAKEFGEVRALISSTQEAEHGRMIVVEAVQKVVSPVLEQRFMEHRAWIRKRRGPSKPVGLKFHGTTREAALNIIAEGFKMPTNRDEQGRFLSGDQRKLPMRGAHCDDSEDDFKRFLMMGGGIYFATSSSKGSLFTKGGEAMLLCELECGRMQERSEPCFSLDLQALQDKGYDSIFVPASSDCTGTSSEEFVVYSPDGAIPRFLVLFRSVALRTVEYCLHQCSLARALDVVMAESSKVVTMDDTSLKAAVFNAFSGDALAQVPALESIGNLCRDHPARARLGFSEYRDRLLNLAKCSANEAATWHCLRIVATIYSTEWADDDARNWGSQKLLEMAEFLSSPNHAIVQKAATVLNNLLLSVPPPGATTAAQLVRHLMSALTAWHEPMTQLYVLSALRNLAMNEHACRLVQPSLPFFINLLTNSASKHPDWLRWNVDLLNNMMLTDKNVFGELSRLHIGNCLNEVLKSGSASHPETAPRVLQCLNLLVSKVHRVQQEVHELLRKGLVTTVCRWSTDERSRLGSKCSFVKPGDTVRVWSKENARGKVLFGPDDDGDFKIRLDDSKDESYYKRDTFGVLGGDRERITFWTMQLLHYLHIQSVTEAELQNALPFLATVVKKYRTSTRASDQQCCQWAAAILLTLGRRAASNYSLTVSDLEALAKQHVSLPNVTPEQTGLCDED